MLRSSMTKAISRLDEYVDAEHASEGSDVVGWIVKREGMVGVYRERQQAGNYNLTFRFACRIMPAVVMNIEADNS